MCGIFGFFGLPARMPSEAASRDALAALAHRGPDAQGLHRAQEHGLVLGHARLSIIDPEARSDQPFHAGDAVLVFNGEIYNYRQLRSELEREGVVLRTNGDTEVIAAGFVHWGPAVFGRLRGMFAIALFDRRDQALYLARDEFGIKPLCLLPRADEVVFASEVKGIAALRSLSIDGGILTDLLSWGFQMENASLYAGVRHVEPGTVITVRRSAGGSVELASRTLWSLRDAYAGRGPEPGARSLHDSVVASVADHMIADVPVAVALSGGLDSSIVAAAAGELHPGLQAFTFTLSDDTDPEVEHARLLCRHVGLRQTVARMVPGPVDGWLRRVAWHLEEPVANINALVSYGLAAVLHEHDFKVVLVGEGADELFGGYPWYRLALEGQGQPTASAVFDAYRKRRALSATASLLRPAATELAAQRHAEQSSAFGEAVRTAGLHGFLAFDQQTQLQYSQLLRVDRMYMAHGVEARVPFLYRTLAEASAALPAHRMLPSLTAGGRAEKVALAEAFAPVLPRQILERPKFGERGTVNIWSTWLAEGLAGEFDRCLHGAELRGARQLLEEFIDWRSVGQTRLAAKERFALALLIEAVDGVLLARQRPVEGAVLRWDVVA